MTTQWIRGTAGDWSDAADWQSGMVPTSTDDAVISSSMAVTVNGTAVANLLTLDASILTLSGTLTLGTSLTVDNGAQLLLIGGTLSAQSISSNNNGSLSGYGTVGGAVSGDVDINATGGILKIQGSLAADQGHLDIGSGTTLELGNSAPVGAPISFQGSPATLKLDAPTAFTGTIRDIVVGDEIDLAGITASSASYSGTTLTINETNGQQLIYNNVSGNVAGDPVNVASDNNGGTDVYWGTAPATTTQWIRGTAGDWSDAADWQSGMVPTSTDDAVISSSMAVTVNGTAVANLLTLDASILTLSGTLTLGTSLTVDNGAQLLLIGGTLSAQSISSNNNGSLSGYGTVGGAVSGDVDINATGGILKIQGSLAADQGHLDIGSGTTLELGNSAPVGAPISFQGSPATLKLDAPTAFTGTIRDIVVGDEIDLAGITASSASYSGTTLTINETNGQQLIYNNVSGSLAGDSVTVASDSHGGTLVYWINGPPPVPTVVADTAHVSVAGTVTANAAHGVLANDTDPIPNDTMSVSAVDGLASDVGHAIAGKYGALTLNANGSYSYVANHSVPSDIIAQDIFTYTATDGDGGSATSSLTITITQPGQTYIAGTPSGAAPARSLHAVPRSAQRRSCSSFPAPARWPQHFARSSIAPTARLSALP